MTISNSKRNQLSYISRELMHHLTEYDQDFVVTVLWRVDNNLSLSDKQVRYVDLVLNRVRVAEMRDVL